MASATATEHGASAAPRRADAFSPPRDVYAASYWSTSHAAASSAMRMTPPPTTRPPPPPAASSFASRAIVTPLSTGNVSMPSASGGFAQRSAGMRARQQLAPRQLEYSVQDADNSKRDGSDEVKQRTAVCPSTPPRVAATPTPVAVPVTPTPSPQYYAVARGRRVGVYTSIAEVYEETQGYDYHVYRAFASREEAERFIDRYFDVTHGRRGDPDPRHKSTLVAFCDGATQGTRNWSHQTGVACIFPHNSAWDIVYTCLDAYCTAYRATAKAALAAIKRANMENPARDQVLYIYTRNQLLVRAMTEWMEKWLLNDWRKGDGHPVKNRDVLQSIVDAQGKRRVIWRLEDHWDSEWTASVVSAAEDASVDVGELLDAACM